MRKADTAQHLGLVDAVAHHRASRERVSRRRPAGSRCAPNQSVTSGIYNTSSVDFARPVTWEKTTRASSLSSNCDTLGTYSRWCGYCRRLGELYRSEDASVVAGVLCPLRRLEDRALRLGHDTQEGHHVGFLWCARTNLDAAEEMCCASSDAAEAGSGAPTMAPRKGRNGCNRAPLPVCECVCKQKHTRTKCAMKGKWK